MKKILFFILVLVLTVSSCNLFVNEEYGELILSFDGTLPDGARALDSNGLPVLSSTNMKIKIVRENGYTIIRELAAEESKSLIELVPIGEKIEITVTASNASSQWSGKKTHTVTSGRNQVIVLLSKKASGLNKLLFTQTKVTAAWGATSYNLTLYMDGKPITVPQSTDEGHIFARDSKGRVYVRYKAGGTYVVRYTSEGENDGTPVQSAADSFANDYTAGKMYGLSGRDLKEIDEDLNHTSGSLSPPVVISVPFAADKGIFTWADLGSSVIYLWKSGMGTATPGVFHTQADTYHLNDNAGFKVKDIFIRGSYVYVLFAGVNDTISSTNANIYSFGAVLKWKIGTNPNGGPRFEGNPEIIGMKANRVFADGVLQNYDYSKNFYGAVKVIGFDEENIYIADDGFDAADTPAGAHIVKNRNRIGVLNMNTNALSFTDAYPAKWYTEWKEWKTPNTKTIVWKRNVPGFVYYQLDRGNEALNQPQLLTNNCKDVFCYDLDGNLYIVKNDDKISMYPQVEGAYSGNLQYTTNNPVSDLNSKSGMAVDSSALDGNNYLYYVDNSNKIKRLKWQGNDFVNASQDTASVWSNGINLGSAEPSAMAANKDGLFVALKEDVSSTNNYKITVQKYDRDGNPDDDSMEISSGSTNGGPHNPIVEFIHSMQILNGRLYAVSYKTVGAGDEDNHIAGNDSQAVVSGKLLDLGLTSDELPNEPHELWSGTQEDKGYAPYRFIAVKPKELVIANDGFYGEDTNQVIQPGNQRNKVLTFSLSGPLLNEISTNATFSRELEHKGPGCGFIWY